MKGYVAKLLFIAILTFIVSYVLVSRELIDFYSILLGVIIFGALPVINAHLVARYIRGWPQRHQLPAMLIMATVSFLFYAHIIFLGVLIAIGLNKFIYRKRTSAPVDKQNGYEFPIK